MRTYTVSHFIREKASLIGLGSDLRMYIGDAVLCVLMCVINLHFDEIYLRFVPQQSFCCIVLSTKPPFTSLNDYPNTCREVSDLFIFRALQICSHHNWMWAVYKLYRFRKALTYSHNHNLAFIKVALIVLLVHNCSTQHVGIKQSKQA